jgi:hypothetical protein
LRPTKDGGTRKMLPQGEISAFSRDSHGFDLHEFLKAMEAMEATKALEATKAMEAMEATEAMETTEAMEAMEAAEVAYTARPMTALSLGAFRGLVWPGPHAVSGARSAPRWSADGDGMTSRAVSAREWSQHIGARLVAGCRCDTRAVTCL